MANILHGASTGTIAGDYPDGGMAEQTALPEIPSMPPALAPPLRIAVTVHLQSVPQFKYRVNVRPDDMRWEEFIEICCRKLAINEKHHVECIVDSSGAFITEISDIMEGDILAVKLNSDLPKGLKTVGIIRPNREAVRKAAMVTAKGEIRQEENFAKSQMSRAVIEGFIFTKDKRPVEGSSTVVRDPHEPVYPEGEEEKQKEEIEGNALPNAANSELEWIGPAASDSWDKVPFPEEDEQSSNIRKNNIMTPKATCGVCSGSSTSKEPKLPSSGRRTRPPSARGSKQNKSIVATQEEVALDVEIKNYDGPRSTTGNWGKGSAKQVAIHDEEQRRRRHQRPRSAGLRAGRPQHSRRGSEREKDSPKLRSIASEMTCDELQLIIADAIRQWGRRIQFNEADFPASDTDNSLLVACHKAISAIDTTTSTSEDRDSTKLHDQQGSPTKDGAMVETSISKLQFTRALKELLLLDVPWANADYLWTRILRVYERERPALVKRRKALEELANEEENAQIGDFENFGGVLFDEIAEQPQRQKILSKQSHRRFEARNKSYTNDGFPIDTSCGIGYLKKSPTSHLTCYQFEQAFGTVSQPAQSPAEKGNSMDVEFGRVMDAMDADNLLLHEAFAVFDCNGDGLISCGEFLRVLKRMEPPLNISKQTMFSMFLAMCNHPDRDRYISPTKFVDFFTQLYMKRQKLLRDMLGKVADDMETIQDLIDAENNRDTKQGLLAQKRRLNQLLRQLKAMTRRVSFTVQAGKEYVRHNENNPADPGGHNGSQGSVDVAETEKADTADRISAINNLLSNRIKMRTAVLPLKRQILGQTYGLSGDAMQQTVESATWQLKMELNELDVMRLDDNGAIMEASSAAATGRA